MRIGRRALVGYNRFDTYGPVPPFSETRFARLAKIWTKNPTIPYSRFDTYGPS
jgi:hypothetical protein